MNAILYISHGTRSKKGEGEAHAFLQKVMTLVDVPIQEICFLELSQPSIEEGFRLCVEKGASNITVVPVFLLAAGHIKRDIPDKLAQIQKEYPHITISLNNAIGVHEEILDGIVEMVTKHVPTLNSHDGVLVVGRGSSDPHIHHAFSLIESGLQKRLGVECISTCYLAVAEPKLQDGLELMLKKNLKRIIVIPYLLFSGLLLSEVNKVCKNYGSHIVLIEPLSRHSAVERLVAEIARGNQNMQPLYINLQGKRVVIVGGGRIAARKGKALVDEKAEITFIAPEFSEEVLALAKEKGFSLHKRTAVISDFDDAFLIILATNNPAVNKKWAKEISPLKLVCVVDDGETGNTIFPATVERGQLQIAITTNGASPKLSMKIKESLEAQFDDHWETYTKFLSQCRSIIKKLEVSIEEKNNILEQILDEKYRINPLFRESKLAELAGKPQGNLK